MERMVDDRVTRASMFERLRSAEPRDRELAWADFSKRYAPIVAGFAKRCGAGPHDVEDIVQDVTASFFAVSGDFAYDPSKGRFRGWLKTCTVRAAMRRAGKNLRFRGVPFDELPEVELAVEGVWDDVWEQQIVAAAVEQLRQSAGTSLPFRAFEQYVLLDRAADEVARELGTTVENVHQAKSRMLKRLRGIVTELRDAEP